MEGPPSNGAKKLPSDYVRALLSDDTYKDDNDENSKHRIFRGRVHVLVRGSFCSITLEIILQDATKAWLAVDMIVATVFIIHAFPISLLLIPIYAVVFGLAVYGLVRDCPNSLLPLRALIVNIEDTFRSDNSPCECRWL